MIAFIRAEGKWQVEFFGGGKLTSSTIYIDHSLVILCNMVLKSSCAGILRGLWDELNQGLFPGIDDNIGELDAKHRLFRTVCEAVLQPPARIARRKDRARPRAREGRAPSAAGGRSSSPSSRCSAWSADGACPEMGGNPCGNGVRRPYRPPPHCLKNLPAPARHERWRNRSARLPSNDLPDPAYRGFEITSLEKASGKLEGSVVSALLAGKM